MNRFFKIFVLFVLLHDKQKKINYHRDEKTISARKLIAVSVPDCSRTAVGSPTSPAEDGSSSTANGKDIK